MVFFFNDSGDQEFKDSVFSRLERTLLAQTYRSALMPPWASEYPSGSWPGNTPQHRCHNTCRCPLVNNVVAEPVRVYRRCRKDRGPTEFLHQDRWRGGVATKRVQKATDFNRGHRAPCEWHFNQPARHHQGRAVARYVVEPDTESCESTAAMLPRVRSRMRQREREREEEEKHTKKWGVEERHTQKKRRKEETHQKMREEYHTQEKGWERGKAQKKRRGEEKTHDKERGEEHTHTHTHTHATKRLGGRGDSQRCPLRPPISSCLSLHLHLPIQKRTCLARAQATQDCPKRRTPRLRMDRTRTFR